MRHYARARGFFSSWVQVEKRDRDLPFPHFGYLFVLVGGGLGFEGGKSIMLRFVDMMNGLCSYLSFGGGAEEQDFARRGFSILWDPDGKGVSSPGAAWSRLCKARIGRGWNKTPGKGWMEHLQILSRCFVCGIGDRLQEMESHLSAGGIC